MEVDHFDSRQKNDVIQNYQNLFLATRHCNGAKDDHPTPRERSARLRLLNPCKEWDYGTNILENPRTHELVGITPEGIYHVRICDLNADHLVTERAERAELRRLLRTGMTVKHPVLAEESITALVEMVGRMIPDFPYLSDPTPSQVSAPVAVGIGG